jgi:hypothetical protein
MLSPWTIQPVFFHRGNLRVIFQPGVVVQAKNDSFHGGDDALFMLKAPCPGPICGPGHNGHMPTGFRNMTARVTNLTIDGYGATWTMRKQDCVNKRWYTPSQYRHALTILYSTNITVRGLLITNTCGDGVDIRGEHILLEDLVIDGAYRNGISVIEANDLLVRNCVVQNTIGIDPEAGLDIEPDPMMVTEDFDKFKLSNIRFVNVSFINNFAGITMSLGQMNGTHNPVSISFVNVTVNGTGVVPGRQEESRLYTRTRLRGASANAVVVGGHDHGCSATGSVEFRNLHVMNTRGGAGLNVEDKRSSGATVLFQDVLLEAVGAHSSTESYDNDTSPINVLSANVSWRHFCRPLHWQGQPPGPPPPLFPHGRLMPAGGVHFVNVTVVDTANRPFAKFVDPVGFRDITGTFKVVNSKQCNYYISGPRTPSDIKISCVNKSAVTALLKSDDLADALWPTPQKLKLKTAHGGFDPFAFCGAGEAGIEGVRARGESDSPFGSGVNQWCCGNTTWSAFSWCAKATRNVKFALQPEALRPGELSNASECAHHTMTAVDCFSLCFNSSHGGGCSPINASDPLTPPAYPADTWTDWREFSPSDLTLSQPTFASVVAENRTTAASVGLKTGNELLNPTGLPLVPMGVYSTEPLSESATSIREFKHGTNDPLNIPHVF